MSTTGSSICTAVCASAIVPHAMSTTGSSTICTAADSDSNGSGACTRITGDGDEACAGADSGIDCCGGCKVDS